MTKIYKYFIDIIIVIFLAYSVAIFSSRFINSFYPLTINKGFQFKTKEKKQDYNIKEIISMFKIDNEISLDSNLKDDSGFEVSQVKDNFSLSSIQLLGYTKGKVNKIYIKYKNKYKIIKQGEKIDENIIFKGFKDNKVVILVNNKIKYLNFLPFKFLQKDKNNRNKRFSNKSLNSSSKVISRKEVDNLLKDTASLVKGIALNPYKDKGFIIVRLEKYHILYKLGLRRGDIITDLNGNSISNLDDVFRFKQMLKNENHLYIGIIRRGKKKRIDIDIR